MCPSVFLSVHHKDQHLFVTFLVSAYYLLVAFTQL